TAFATAGASMVIIALVGSYLATRDATGANWLVNNQIPLTQPNMQLITLGMSAVTMQWAVWAIARDDRYHSYMALGLTLLLGLAFVNQTTFLYKMAGITIEQAEGPLFYAVTGSHLALMIAALIFMVLMGFRTLAGQYSSRQPDGLGAAAIVWYAGIALYAVIWFAVYVQK
ncbi:MAG TPA: cytochrome c oxidase subunit 3, partial [Microthrixaceae bacterium]|nr:cytochrome c oxidase subunit 3 [Microthrixaceae bacterium]